MVKCFIGGSSFLHVSWTTELDFMMLQKNMYVLVWVHVFEFCTLLQDAFLIGFWFLQCDLGNKADWWWRGVEFFEIRKWRTIFMKLIIFYGELVDPCCSIASVDGQISNFFFISILAFDWQFLSRFCYPTETYFQVQEQRLNRLELLQDEWTW